MLGDRQYRSSLEDQHEICGSRRAGAQRPALGIRSLERHAISNRPSAPTPAVPDPGRRSSQVKQLPKLHYAGIDWATKTHAVCVVDQAGQIRARFQVPTPARALPGSSSVWAPSGWPAWRSNATTVRWWKPCWRPTCAWSWSPRSRSRAYAAGIGPAGPSPIPPTPTCWLRCWGPTATAWPRSPRQRADQDPAGAVAHPQRPRRARVALVNQLTSQLEGCCPGAIGLFQELHSPTAVAFLGRYPTSHAAATLTQATLAALLRRLHYSGRTPASELLRRLQTAPAAGISPAEAAGRAVCVLALLDAIQVTSRQERELEAEIIERLEVHADQHIFTSLPRAGHGVRAALLAELGDVGARFPTEEALAAQGGAAPVTITSGKRRVVKFRWACDKKLRAALLDFADDSRHASPWAAKIYAEAIQRIWQDGVAYDPTKHRGE